MWLKSVAITNFKSFLDRQQIDFQPGFNLLLGANNCGKSTVLEALSNRSQQPHRSERNARSRLAASIGNSIFELRFSTNVQELRYARLNPEQEAWVLPFPGGDLNEFGAWVRSQLETTFGLCDPLTLVTTSEQGSACHAAYAIRKGFEEIAERIERTQSIEAAQIRESVGGTSRFESLVGGYGPGSFVYLGEGCRQWVYRFEAHRTPPEYSGLSNDGRLRTNASNLPGCINHLLATDNHLHHQLCLLVQRVLPSIRWVQAPPEPNGNTQVRLECLPCDPSKGRSDLAVPLSQLGSGVGAVISILYVALTAREPQIICIDEPNQFLHPKALRELLLILANEGKRHQYILTAHSADVLASVDAATITMLTLDRGVTKVEQTDTAGIKAFRAGLADLGIRPTDLHSRDRVLWVEGQTEELVFPKLIAHFCPLQAAGTAVVRVHSTGVFDRKGSDAVAIAESYQKLSAGASIVPPMVAIVLDSEGRSAKVRKELEADKRAVLRFLPRKMLENYALHPQAIKAALQSRGEVIEATIIEEALLAEAKIDSLEALDLEGVDGAKLLIGLFSSLTEARIEFRKTLDTPEMFTWLLENAPEHLESLGDWIRALLKEVQ